MKPENCLYTPDRLKAVLQTEKFVVPPSGGSCEIRKLSLHAGPPEGGTTNFSDLLNLIYS